MATCADTDAGAERTLPHPDDLSVGGARRGAAAGVDARTGKEHDAAGHTGPQARHYAAASL